MALATNVSLAAGTKLRDKLFFVCLFVILWLLLNQGMVESNFSVHRPDQIKERFKKKTQVRYNKILN